MTSHRHLQLNIKQTMPSWKIRSDVAKAFSLNPDTIVFNEAVTVTQVEIRRQADALGYHTMILPKAAGQVVLAWKDKHRELAKGSKQTMQGRHHVTPNRYVNRVKLELESGEILQLVGTHMVSSGWTGTRWLDAWRQQGWNKHELILRNILRWTYKHNDLVLWSGDCNRPPSTFPGKPFANLQIKGAATSQIVHTDATHGKIIFDYVGVLSKSKRVRVVSATTPSFWSDHDGVLVDLEW